MEETHGRLAKAVSVEGGSWGKKKHNSGDMRQHTIALCTCNNSNQTAGPDVNLILHMQNIQTLRPVRMLKKLYNVDLY